MSPGCATAFRRKRTLLRRERAALLPLTVQKNGNTSTLSIIAGIKSLLPFIKTIVPPEMDIKTFGGPIHLCEGRH